jgi:hypothetical protein
MADPAGESESGALRLDFDRRLTLQFRGSVVASDAGLLAYGELDDALGLTALAGEMLADARTGKNGRHALVCPNLLTAGCEPSNLQCANPLNCKQLLNGARDDFDHSPYSDKPSFSSQSAICCISRPSLRCFEREYPTKIEALN